MTGGEVARLLDDEVQRLLHATVARANSTLEGQLCR